MEDKNQNGEKRPLENMEKLKKKIDKVLEPTPKKEEGRFVERETRNVEIKLAEKHLSKLSENTEVSRQLDEDIRKLISALNKHRRSSKRYSRALIALTVALIFIGAVQIIF